MMNDLMTNMRRGWLDFLLAGLGGIMVTYSTGMSVASPRLAILFAILTGIGTIVSFLVVHFWGQSKFVKNSVWLYVIVALACPFISNGVNAGLPDGGFPRELMTSAAPLIWMVALGSFVAWTDGSLTFQSVPSIALFGLVGAFNTFAGATIAFFVFLVASASLYARTHQRHMLDRAEQSGYRQITTIRQGPWRWMAGPEWALGSAAAIIVLSLIGAPILQESVKTVAGQVRVIAPKVQPPAPVQAMMGQLSNERTSVGTGPRGELSEEVILRVKMEEPRYLRTNAYNVYSDGTWNRVNPPNSMDTRGRTARFMSPTKEDLEANFEEQTFTVNLKDYPFDRFPVASPFFYVEPPTGLNPEFDGTIRIVSSEPRQRLVVGHFYARQSDSIPRTAVENPNPYTEFFTSTDSMSQKVIEHAKTIRKPGMTDYEVGLAVTADVAKRAKYNLKAEAGPTGIDPVENFLFGSKREGYCDLFASSVVQMARANGIPARYINGFFPILGETDENGFYKIRKADYHAWAELYFDGYGWMAFDATEAAESVPGGERGSAKDLIPWYKGQQARILQNVVLGLIAAMGVFLVTRASKAIAAETDHTNRALDRAFQTYIRALERASGVSRSPSQSPQEYFDAINPLVQGDTNGAQVLAGRFMDAFYRPGDVSLKEAQGLLDEAGVVAKQLKSYSKSKPRA